MLHNVCAVRFVIFALVCKPKLKGLVASPWLKRLLHFTIQVLPIHWHERSCFFVNSLHSLEWFTRTKCIVKDMMIYNKENKTSTIMYGCLMPSNSTLHRDGSRGRVWGWDYNDVLTFSITATVFRQLKLCCSHQTQNWQTQNGSQRTQNKRTQNGSQSGGSWTNSKMAVNELKRFTLKLCLNRLINLKACYKYFAFVLKIRDRTNQFTSSFIDGMFALSKIWLLTL